MTRACAVIAAAAALLPISLVATTAGASASTTTDVYTQRRVPKLRGARRTTATEPLSPSPTTPSEPMCSSIECPSGHIPIADNATTECDGGACTVRQCCDATCAHYGCPNGYTPIESMAGDFCHDGICTRHQCCEAETPMCNSIACPNGLEHIDDAWEVECHYGECEIEQCCGATCASHPCPSNYTPIDHAAQVFCTNDVCTTAQCCDSTDQRLAPGQTSSPTSRPSSSSSIAFCKDYECPGGYLPMSGMGQVECFDHECEADECCERDPSVPDEAIHDYCSSFPCPSETHRPIDQANKKRCQFVDFDHYQGSFSYYYYYDDDVVGSDDVLEAYDFEVIDSGRGNGSSSSHPSDHDHNYSYGFVEPEEYCDLDTCCMAKEYGLWGLE